MDRPLQCLWGSARRANQPAHLDLFAKSIFAGKNFPLSPSGKSPLGLLPSRARSRGVSRSSRHVGRGMRWTRLRRDDERCRRGRQSRGVLIPRCWYQVLKKLTLLRDDGDKKPVSGETTKETVKTIRVRECRGIRRVPAVTNSRVFYFPREAAGALATRHSPRPLWAKDKWTARASRVAGMCIYVRQIF